MGVKIDNTLQKAGVDLSYKTKIPCTFLGLIHKIANFVKTFFLSIFFPSKLSDKQVTEKPPAHQEPTQEKVENIAAKALELPIVEEERVNEKGQLVRDQGTSLPLVELSEEEQQRELIEHSEQLQQMSEEYANSLEQLNPGQEAFQKSTQQFEEVLQQELNNKSNQLVSVSEIYDRTLKELAPEESITDKTDCAENEFSSEDIEILKDHYIKLVTSNYYDNFSKQNGRAPTENELSTIFSPEEINNIHQVTENAIRTATPAQIKEYKNTLETLKEVQKDDTTINYLAALLGAIAGAGVIAGSFVTSEFVGNTLLEGVFKHLEGLDQNSWKRFIAEYAFKGLTAAGVLYKIYDIGKGVINRAKVVKSPVNKGILATGGVGLIAYTIYKNMQGYRKIFKGQLELMIIAKFYKYADMLIKKLSTQRQSTNVQDFNTGMTAGKSSAIAYLAAIAGLGLSNFTAVPLAALIGAGAVKVNRMFA